MKELPTGLQVFEKIRNANAVYVDKTDIIYNIISGAKMQFFLSRPRRFGKTLMCWTLDALFSGKRELFEGLAISKTDWKWEKYPIIRLDMSDIKTASGIEDVNESLFLQAKKTAIEHEIDLHGVKMPGVMLDWIITGVSKKHGKPVVVIVDEYDRPFLDFYNKPEVAQKVREIMRDYYITLKSNEQHMRFLFMTGISKFSKMGVFSALNNMIDISLTEKYGTWLGYTENELVEYFGDHIKTKAEELNLTFNELIEKMRHQYNGFCFDGSHKVYCPFSVLNFLESGKFLNYWMTSATPKIIADYMKDRNLTVEQFRGMQVSKDFASSPGEIETARPESFLYQSGYLTLREGISDDFSLDYPNAEVLDSMSSLVYNNIMRSGGDDNFMDLRTPLLDALVDGNSELLIKTMNQLLASIPYDDYAKAAFQAIELSGIPAQEWLYRSTILAFLRGCGVLVFGELHGNKGRADLLVSHKGKAWIIEIKVAYNDDSAEKAKEAITQISEKQYADQFKTAKKVGIAIDDKLRQIKEWIVE
ncbi:MAG: ATP-binding protein [Chitinispirillales bacterium]|nr:ATP-binding protein [Chitinispirillales bacterium]